MTPLLKNPAGVHACACSADACEVIWLRASSAPALRHVDDGSHSEPRGVLTPPAALEPSILPSASPTNMERFVHNFRLFIVTFVIIMHFCS